MKVITPDTLALLYAVSPLSDRQQGECRLVLGCVACFPFAAHVDALLPEAALWDCAKAELPPNVPLDEGQPKPHAEFLVYGACHAPPDRGITRARDVEVRVGRVRKKLTIFGERFWHGSRHGDPDPFARMPLTWENAFGGADNPYNPQGKGQDVLLDGKCPLPNVEHHGEYVSFPHDMPEPAGLGAVPSSWLPRRDFAGNFDRHWFEKHWPDLPGDCHPHFFMRSQQDQWLEGFFTGGESFEIFGMHPRRELLQGVLPDLRCRVFLLRGAGDGGEFQELATRADTLTLFPERQLGALTFRAVTHTSDEECGDIAALMPLFEPATQPAQPAQCYRELMEQALNPPRMAAADASQTVEEPESVEALESEPEEEKYATGQEQGQPELPGLAALQQAVGEIEAESRKLLARSGLSEQEVQGFMDKVEAQTREQFLELLPPEQLERTAGAAPVDPVNELRSLVQELEARGKEMLRKSGKSEEEVEALLQKHARAQEMPDLQREFAPRLEDPEVPENVKAGMRGMIDAAADITSVCASLEQLGQALKAEDGASPEPQISAEPAVVPEPEKEPLSLTRDEVLARYKKGQSLANTDLSGRDLSQLDLQGADLQNALLLKTNLRGSNLAQANLQNADCSQAILDGCNLEGADVSGACLERSSMKRIAAKGLIAHQTGFQEADATQADFSQAVMQDADFTRAVLDKASFRKARTQSLRLLGASLANTDFREAGLRDSRGDTQTVATRADFSGANMTLSGWRGACLHEANFKQAVLDDADFGHCNLQSANMERVQARNTVFFKADLQQAHLPLAVLEGANLRRAHLAGANLSRASLRGADLYKCRLNDTDLCLAELGQTILDPDLLHSFSR